MAIDSDYPGAASLTGKLVCKAIFPLAFFPGSSRREDDWTLF